mmetsp:Transcript_10916/g.33662  ORF Transcript_10916/g.33662 Transcript_10916/m.33662 type:complete len:250 (-) Transcript_10916:276-1025(-)
MLPAAAMFRSCASSNAMRAPCSALCLISAMLAASDAPPVSSLTRRSRKGVTSRPSIPAALASPSAVSMADCTFPASASASAGMGTATSMPESSPSRKLACTSAAASAASSTRSGVGQPEFRVKKAGNSSVPSAATATPLVSSTSSVRGISRIDLMPAETTHTGVRPSSDRSADTSIDASPPRCTPPTPPVTKTSMPARCASSIVAETVVAPCPLRATTAARSLREHLATFAGPSLASRSSCSGVRPTKQ